VRAAIVPLHWKTGDRAAYRGGLVTIRGVHPEVLTVQFAGGAMAVVAKDSVDLPPLPFENEAEL
jgi:hypothetical protein